MVNQIPEVDESIAGEGYALISVNKETGELLSPPASALGQGTQMTAEEFHRQCRQMEGLVPKNSEK